MWCEEDDGGFLSEWRDGADYKGAELSARVYGGLAVRLVGRRNWRGREGGGMGGVEGYLDE